MKKGRPKGARNKVSKKIASIEPTIPVVDALQQTLDSPIDFGKHRDPTYRWAVKHDLAYLHWLYRQKRDNGEFADNSKPTLNGLQLRRICQQFPLGVDDEAERELAAGEPLEVVVDPKQAPVSLKEYNDLAKTLNACQAELNLKRHSCGEMCLVLFHGRDDPDEDLDDWGDQGPVLGLFNYCHVTYASDVKVAGDADINSKEFESCLYIIADLLYYDNKYYGDWSVTTVERLSPDEISRLVAFDETKTKPTGNNKYSTYDQTTGSFSYHSHEPVNPLEDSPRAWMVNCPHGHEYDYMVFPDESQAQDAANNLEEETEAADGAYAPIPLYALRKDDNGQAEDPGSDGENGGENPPLVTGYSAVGNDAGAKADVSAHDEHADAHKAPAVDVPADPAAPPAGQDQQGPALDGLRAGSDVAVGPVHDRPAAGAEPPVRGGASGPDD